MLKYILLGLVVVVVAFVIVVMNRPDTFKMARSITIAAPPAVIFGHVNDPRQFQEWSPWAKMDPSAKVTFSGLAAGKDSGFAWEGNSKVGAGSMTCVESRPNDLIGFRLDFLKPFKGTNLAEFAFQPEGDQTRVTWSMSGSLNFVTKAIGLVMDCDQMVGPQFEQGLANLKTLAEAEARNKKQPLIDDPIRQ